MVADAMRMIAKFATTLGPDRGHIMLDDAGEVVVALERGSQGDQIIPLFRLHPAQARFLALMLDSAADQAAMAEQGA